MAIKWAQGETFTLEEARDEFIKISEFLTTKYGSAHDSSIQDTYDWIVKDYFNFQQSTVAHDIDIHDIKAALYQGNLVIVPVNGRLLTNPYFTPPGPLQHQILITGYDATTQEFITHEPGTRWGSDFKYSSAELQDSIANYESGNLTYMPEIRTTSMILIAK